jgi:hypothetical protein
MMTCVYAGEPLTEPRSHPWVDVAGKPDCRYYDLTASPGRIRTSLEDFQSWSHYAAIEAFYVLLEWLNEPTSTLESNDCAFSGPDENTDLAIAKPLQCSGRLMVLFRSLAHNTDKARMARLESDFHHDLGARDPSFRWGLIGTTVVPVRYRELSGTPGQQLGSQLMLSFWAWGDSEADTMLNLGRLFENLSRALRTVSTRA